MTAEPVRQTRVSGTAIRQLLCLRWAGAEVAQVIRHRVHSSTQLTCSCGVAPNRLLAKICSDINKPNGQAVLLPDPAAIKKFVDDLPVRKVPMIGKVQRP